MNGEFDLTLLREFAAACRTPAFFTAFVEASLADLHTACGALEGAAARGAWQEFQGGAHAIKGLAATIGAVRLVAVASTAMNRDVEEMHECWSDDLLHLRAALRRANLALDATLAIALAAP